jgi:hypothetical protein
MCVCVCACVGGCVSQARSTHVPGRVDGTKGSNPHFVPRYSTEAKEPISDTGARGEGGVVIGLTANEGRVIDCDPSTPLSR